MVVLYATSGRMYARRTWCYMRHTLHASSAPTHIVGASRLTRMNAALVYMQVRFAIHPMFCTSAETKAAQQEVTLATKMIREKGLFQALKKNIR